MRHLFPTDRIAGLLDAERGLTAEEVEERRRYGGNDILGDRGSGWGDIARDTARDSESRLRADRAVSLARRAGLMRVVESVHLTDGHCHVSRKFAGQMTMAATVHAATVAWRHVSIA